jgi:hypothetical protein
MRRRTPFTIAVFVAATALAQEATRQLWNTEFINKRPAPASAAAPAKPVSYRPIAGSKLAGPGANGTIQTTIGITLWRLRDPKPAETGNTRLLVLERPGAQTREQIPERVDTSTLLSNGDQVRLTIEVPSSGYLYVIDREEYADGTTSDPYLIYPNWQTKPGDHAVAPGRLLEIPDRRDTPNVFTLRPKRADETAEVLAMLIAPSPLPDLKIGNEPLRLGRKTYDDWQQRWGAQSERLELVGGAGAVWTGQENDAGANHNHLLTRDDAPPQTLYRVMSKPGSPIMVQVPLRIKK